VKADRVVDPDVTGDLYLCRAHEYTVVVVPRQEGRFLATATDFPGVMGDGETPADAERDCRSALADMMEHLEVLGRPVPEPMSRYSGQFQVRVPRTVHMALVQRAQAEGVSLNALVHQFLVQGLGLNGVLPAPRKPGRPKKAAAG
jgi:predicted RNase H-like HicB family nuclease